MSDLISRQAAMDICDTFKGSVIDKHISGKEQEL